jgi:hypothetical protein
MHGCLDHLWLENLFQRSHYVFEFTLESDFIQCLVVCYPNLYGDRLTLESDFILCLVVCYPNLYGDRL